LFRFRFLTGISVNLEVGKLVFALMGVEGGGRCLFGKELRKRRVKIACVEVTHKVAGAFGICTRAPWYFV
jgi:hypothetical protein